MLVGLGVSFAWEEDMTEKAASSCILVWSVLGGLTAYCADCSAYLDWHTVWACVVFRGAGLMGTGMMVRGQRVRGQRV